MFSVNKSGEYFDYARIIFFINDESAATTEFPSGISIIVNKLDLSNTILIPATEFALKGRVIDDFARSTIFWEADLTGSEDKLRKNFKNDKIIKEAEKLICPGNLFFGKLFKIKWILTKYLPFYRTRGLRNP
jgi:hypothetical protein